VTSVKFEHSKSKSVADVTWAASDAVFTHIVIYDDVKPSRWMRLLAWFGLAKPHNPVIAAGEIGGSGYSRRQCDCWAWVD
jgi:hypothetical protein